MDSALHLGRILLGMAKPHVVGQCRAARLRSKSSLPVQVDGEPRYLPGPWQVTVALTTTSLPPSLAVSAAEESASGSADISEEGKAWVLVNDETRFDPGGDVSRHPLARHLIRLYEAERK